MRWSLSAVHLSPLSSVWQRWLAWAERHCLNFSKASRNFQYHGLNPLITVSTKIPNSTTRFCCRHAEVRLQGLTCVLNQEIHLLHHHHTSTFHTTLQSISTYRQIFLQALWSEMVEKWPYREELSCREERKVAIRHPSLASSSKRPKPFGALNLWNLLFGAPSRCFHLFTTMGTPREPTSYVGPSCGPSLGLGGTQFQSLPILCHPLFQASLESLFPPPPEGEDELRRRRRRTVSDGGHSHGNSIIDVSHIN